MAATSLVHTLLSADQSRCILANLSANGDTLANKRGHAATEEEKPMISVPFRGGLKALAAKKSWNLWNAHISCVHMISSISGSL